MFLPRMCLKFNKNSFVQLNSVKETINSAKNRYNLAPLDSSNPQCCPLVALDSRNERPRISTKSLELLSYLT